MLVSVVLTTHLVGGGVDLENPWPMVGGDLQNTGRSDRDTSHVSGEERWNLTIEEGLIGDTSPVVDYDDHIYFSAGPILVSVNRSGVRRWDFFNEAGELSAPCLGPDGTVYVGSRNEEKLYALDRDDGSVLWEFNTIGGITTPPVISPVNVIYFSSYFDEDNSARIYALGTNGNLRWKYNLPEEEEVNSTKVNSRVAIGPDGEIYFSSFDNHVYALNRHGNLIWRKDPAPDWGVSAEILSSPAVRDGVIYVGMINGLSALDTSTGETIWHFPDERHEEYEFGDNVAIWGSPAIGPDGTIYFGCTFSIEPDEPYQDPIRYGRIYALLPDGKVRWHMETNNILMSATPAIGSDGTVYMGTNDMTVYAFEPSGSIIWNYKTWRGSDSSPAIGSDGTVYFVTTGPSPTIFAFTGEKSQGEKPWYILQWWMILIIVGLIAAISITVILLRRRK